MDATETMPPADPRADLVADGVMTLKQAAAFAGCTERQLYRLMDAGVLASVKFGKRRLIPRKALVGLLAASVVSMGSGPAAGPAAP